MSCFVLSILIGFGAESAFAVSDFNWRGRDLKNPTEVLTAASGLATPGERQQFRSVISRRHSDVDGYLGGLITRIGSLEAQEAFAAFFDVEHPILGTPKQIRSQSRNFKILLSMLALRAMDQTGMKHVRAQNLKPTAQQLALFRSYLDAHDMQMHLRDFLAQWDMIENHCHLLLAAKP